MLCVELNDTLDACPAGHFANILIYSLTVLGHGHYTDTSRRLGTNETDRFYKSPNLFGECVRRLAPTEVIRLTPSPLKAEIGGQAANAVENFPFSYCGGKLAGNSRFRNSAESDFCNINIQASLPNRVSRKPGKIIQTENCWNS